MQAEKLYRKLNHQEMDADQLAALIPEGTQPLPTVLDGIFIDKPRVNYICVKALRKVSRAHPNLLYAYFNALIDLLRTAQPIIRNEVIYILANLAQVDSQNKIDESLDTYFEPLDGPNLLTAMSVAKASLRLLAAKPYLGEQIAGELMRVQEGKFENEESHRLIYEEVLNTLQRMKSQPRPVGLAS